MGLGRYSRSAYAFMVGIMYIEDRYREALEIYEEH